MSSISDRGLDAAERDGEIREVDGRMVVLFLMLEKGGLLLINGSNGHRRVRELLLVSGRLRRVDKVLLVDMVSMLL